MKISEVSKIFGISSETLRYLESEGIITPERRTDNAYREYSVIDFGTLVEYMKYRRMGIAIKEIVRLFQSNQFEEILPIVKEKRTSLIESIRQESALLQYMDAFCSKLEVFSHNTGLYDVRILPSFDYISIGQAGTGKEEYMGGSLASSWRKAAPFVSLAYLMQHKDIHLQHIPVQCILGTETEYAKQLGLKYDESVVHIPRQLVLHTYAAFNDFDDNREIYKNAVTFAESRNYHVTGPIMTFLLARLSDEIRYTEICIPIAK